MVPGHLVLVATASANVSALKASFFLRLTRLEKPLTIEKHTGLIKVHNKKV